MNALKIKNLKKTYNDNFELQIDNLEIESGQIIGLIGENGAGKTTLIKSILSLINSNYEEIKIFDKNILTEETEIKKNIGVVLDNMFFPDILTPKDINSVMTNIYDTWDSLTFQKFIETLNLPYKQKIKTLSKGMRKKLEIAVSLSHKPKFLKLDEPTSGLDPISRSEVLDILYDFLSDDEHTIIFSSHITTDLEHIADKIVFLHEGKIILNKNKDELLDNYGILKCNIKDYEKIDKKDIIKTKKNKYNYEILIKDKQKMKKKYKNFIIDKITLEELMLIYIRGE